MSLSGIKVWDKIKFENDEEICSVIAVFGNKLLLDDNRVIEVSGTKRTRVYEHKGKQVYPIYRRHSLPLYDPEYYIFSYISLMEGQVLSEFLLRTISRSLMIPLTYTKFVVETLIDKTKLYPKIKSVGDYFKLNVDENIFLEERKKRHVIFRKMQKGVQPLELI